MVDRVCVKNADTTKFRLIVYRRRQTMSYPVIHKKNIGGKAHLGFVLYRNGK